MCRCGAHILTNMCIVSSWQLNAPDAPVSTPAACFRSGRGGTMAVKGPQSYRLPRQEA